MQEPEYLDAVHRPIGTLYLTRTETPVGWVHEVYIDEQLLMSSVSPLSEEQLTSQALAAHRGEGPLRVLVGGLGLGYTAAVAVKSPRVSFVRVAEKMDFVIRWLEKGLLPLSQTLTQGPRLEFAELDVYAHLLGEPTETWDVLAIDVDHAPEMPLDPASLPFYTAAGQRAVAAHLAPGGVVAVWSAFDDDNFAAAMAEVYPETWRSILVWDSPFKDGTQRLANTLFFGRVAG